MSKLIGWRQITIANSAFIQKMGCWFGLTTDWSILVLINWLWSKVWWQNGIIARVKLATNDNDDIIYMCISVIGIMTEVRQFALMYDI